MAKVQRTCIVCGNGFEVYPSQLKRNPCLYCSLDCWYSVSHKHPEARENRICKRCGNEYECLKSDKRRKSYCSHECAYASREGELHPKYKPEAHVQLICAICKEPFERQRSLIERDNTKCCSVKCMGKYRTLHFTGKQGGNWKGGYDKYYGRNWYEQQRKARERDKHYCRRCGIHKSELGRELDVHHVKPFRTFNGDWRKANRLSNLISLCPKCHKIVEPRKKIRLNFSIAA